ncbi:TetR family transcriptional regulator [Acetobacter cibinongensis]|uniref:TetR family transcriptional regulator n=1 Tax=Acetobacter cibinongensis TaxID=146475 RepID=A0A0D6N708_9PROT|nr:TetR/AcrR family transcriptional regulator [Acetobacter cibinongensis]GAN61485.1 transcriptional regulator TetR [Acetobacter cibinongensis]GEL59645.1 TetR family transcriptional regulator [Acetobacter cibinongensis]
MTRSTKTVSTPPSPRIRDAEATKLRILEAAKKEFAQNGLEGARVDAIALEAQANKRMIYHYFESKENLFKVIIEQAYLDIRSEEALLNLESLTPKDAITEFVKFTWNYYLRNPEFITLVNNENLNKARHIKDSSILREVSKKFVDRIQAILDKGTQDGTFRAGLDAVQVNITIASIGYYYLTNSHTGSVIFNRDFLSKKALQERLAFNIDTILRLLCL